MRYLAIGVVIVALSGCSKAPSDESSLSGSNPSSSQPDQPIAEAGPGGIGLSAAPGVAFSYHYAFRLPSAKIAAAQEGHAQACEKLGIARCRITGMRYQLIGENNVEAMLAFKLDPAIARAFGKNGIAMIQTAEGTLVDAAITGTDAGASIDRIAADRSRAGDELRRLDGELAKSGRSASERTELQGQRAEIARQIATAAADAVAARESLATTPMVFDYGSGRAVRGFDGSAPLTSALDTAIGSTQVTIAVLLGILAIFGPPAVVLLLLWLLWRRFGKVLPWRRTTETHPG
ncbi:hypothetical protein BH09PSE4_BH09PSE4_04090 [soil metagenome]